MAGAAAILVHGSWAGGWCWEPVARSLAAFDVDCHCPTLSGLANVGPDSAACGLGVHVEEILALVDQLGAPVSLVGHSYGTMVVAEVAAQRPDIVRNCVLVDGVVPQAGRSLFERFPQLRARFEARADPGQPDFIQPATPDYLGLTPSLAAEVSSKLRPMPIRTHEEPALHSASRLGCGRHYVAFREFPGRVAMAMEAAEQGWMINVIPGGHWAMMTDPELVAEILARALGVK